MIVKVKHTGASIPTIKKVVEDMLVQKLFKKDCITVENFYGLRTENAVSSDGVTLLTEKTTMAIDVTLSLDVRTKKDKEELEKNKAAIINELEIIRGGCSSIDKILKNITEMIKKIK